MNLPATDPVTEAYTDKNLNNTECFCFDLSSFAMDLFFFLICCWTVCPLVRLPVISKKMSRDEILKHSKGQNTLKVHSYFLSILILLVLLN